MRGHKTIATTMVVVDIMNQPADGRAMRGTRTHHQRFDDGGRYLVTQRYREGKATDNKEDSLPVATRLFIEQIEKKKR